jgi:5-formyltetrahydrofolate cyclo-ligase
MTKSELRSVYLAKRHTLSADDVGAMSRRIADRFFEGFDPEAIRTIHCFISIPRFKEVDTSLILDRIWSDFPHVRTLAPRVARTTDTLESLPVTRETKLTENIWGIRQPAEGETAGPQVIDLVVAPLLCFDPGGHRVGYGKGYYDLFLSECRPDCQKIGLSFFPPVDRIDDLAPHDIPLDGVITPGQTYTFSRR